MDTFDISNFIIVSGAVGTIATSKLPFVVKQDGIFVDWISHAVVNTMVVEGPFAELTNDSDALCTQWKILEIVIIDDSVMIPT